MTDKMGIPVNNVLDIIREIWIILRLFELKAY